MVDRDRWAAHVAGLHDDAHIAYPSWIDKRKPTRATRMAENVPPSSAAAGASAGADATRGLPYYEKLKRDLRETIHKKRMIDKNMAQLEEEIFRLESQYLEDTGAGNIIKGFDQYIKGATTGGSGGGGGGTGAGAGTASRKKGGINEQDRYFSRSSASFTRESSPQSSAQTTPSHAPTPTATQMLRDSHPTPTAATVPKGGGGQKKGTKKAQERDEEGDSDGKAAKRIKITYARGEKGD